MNASNDNLNDGRASQSENVAQHQIRSAKAPEAGGRLVILGVIVLVSLPVAFHGCHEESSRWQAAAAMERYLDGEQEQAIKDLDAVSKQLPFDSKIRLTLAQWYFENRQADRALELLDQLPARLHNHKYFELRIKCLFAVGREAEGIQIYRQANPADLALEEEVLVEHRNNLAYFSALASQELNLSLQNCNSNIDRVAMKWNDDRDLELKPRLQAALCAAIIYRAEIGRPGNDSATRRAAALNSLDILSDIIAKLQNEYDLCCKLEEPTLNREHSKTNVSRRNARPRSKMSAIIRIRDEAASALAAFCTARALVYQDLNHIYEDPKFLAESGNDRENVARLGFRPEQFAKRLPAFVECVNHGTKMARYLDTRGCVHFRLGQQEHALADLNAAVQAQKAIISVAKYSVRTGAEKLMSMDQRQQDLEYVRKPKRTLAVMLYHRSWIWGAIGTKESGSRILLSTAMRYPEYRSKMGTNSDEPIPEPRFEKIQRIPLDDDGNHVELAWPDLGLDEIQWFEFRRADLAEIRDLGFEPGPYLF